MNKYFYVFILLLSLLSSHLALAFIPEASGITKVGGRIVVAGDEEPQSLWIVDEKMNVEQIGVKGGEWNDMEALATIDSHHFFATTSHSLTKKGKRKPEREQLFLMSINKNKISVMKTWNHLRQDIINYLRIHHAKDINMTTVENAIPDEGGLNIEGMTFLDDILYIGLRSPVTQDGKAILLAVKDAQHMPKVSSSLLLGLDGQGIRSLDLIGKDLLVLSGSKNDVATDFGIHRYNLISRKVQSLFILGFERLIRPEGVVSNGLNNLLFVQDFEAGETSNEIVPLRIGPQ